MVMDQDYPMTRRAAIVMVIGLVVMAGIGVALFGGYLTGVKASIPSTWTTTVNGHTFDATYTPLHAPLFSDHTAPWNVTFRNVTFRLWLSNWNPLLGGVVNGIGTEPNGTAYSFALGNPLPNGTHVLLFLAPDYGFGAAWVGGITASFQAEILVATWY